MALSEKLDQVEPSEWARTGLRPGCQTGRLVLRAEGLSKSFGGLKVLDQLTLGLHEGDVVLLMGENGSGKTTLLNILTGNLEPDSGTLEIFTNGSREVFRFPRHWWQELNPFDHFTPERVAREGLGRTWQEIRLFPSQSLRDNVAFAMPGQSGESPALVLLRPGKVRREERANLDCVVRNLADLGLGGRELSTADRVSLGQSKRVGIARAVRGGARLLLLDEPLSGLDGAGVADILGFLGKIARKDGLTLIIVEHVFNVPLLVGMANKIWTMRNGRIEERSAADAGLLNLPAANGQVTQWLGRIFGSATHVERQELCGDAVILRYPRSADMNAAPALDVEDLVVHRGARLVIGNDAEDGTVEGLSFRIRRGEVAVLQAPNGWGKTTLLEAIAGLTPITRGIVRIDGVDVRQMEPWRRRRLGLVFLQARNHTFPGLTVGESLRLCGVKNAKGKTLDLLSRRVSALSGGEKQKLAFSCALDGGDFLAALLDEPFSALDAESLDLAGRYLTDCSRNAGLLLAIPHGHGGDMSRVSH